ncbi:hypothetical protein CIG75_07135 [Tumebacillus algifaecis]|uniref:Uncharacterized protein n=1 Tax=Tumebacillus algifaecis TaxID=1214604 RepID=A0A223CZK4_9BACL|nr:hypothetical protein [Tumebacillus algifaecis]ASS74771.1 hypothetical protein CIG75_07135 [Tumebacillus algifaecis]
MSEQPQMKGRNGNLDAVALHQLFHLQPNNNLTHNQMVRRDLFPRWEVIRPADFNPVDAETRRLQALLAESEKHLH